jgi:hypothetical protein
MSETVESATGPRLCPPPLESPVIWTGWRALRCWHAINEGAFPPSCKRQTPRVRKRTPLCRLSITLVETSQRERLGGKPKRFSVSISVEPSRRLAAAHPVLLRLGDSA